MNKKSLSESDICAKHITPSLIKSGWDETQIRREVTFTDGRIIVRGKLTSRGSRKRADYILYYKPNIPVAVIEAKGNSHSIGDGMQQALEYAQMLDVPFVYSSNGDGFLEHDRTVKDGKVERELSMDEFPSPDNLWQRYKEKNNLTDQHEHITTQEYFYEPEGITPRYYQRIAINRTVEAIAKGENRILLVMATGTGKTFTAFQVVYRLWKSGLKKRILYLADRNILIDQAKSNDFRHLGDKMTKVVHRKVDKAHEIYLALYQGISGNEEEKNIYKQFSPDFFDLVIIDECHRGSAREDSAWRDILEYFNSASQIGMTATPRETKEISNIDYFGEPLYTYSLKQGIEDGFLAPYKVIRVTLDRDAEGYIPTKGKKDKYGEEIEYREYNTTDFDKNLVLEKRTETVAKMVSDYLKKNNSRFDKTIFFCVDIEHAERMRQALVNENSDLVHENEKYVMRITGDNEEGKKELDNFIYPESRYPTLVTTSKLMTTGVDCKTCKYIVLDSNIQSMTEFKQIIGRGTRVREDFNKLYFSIIDFRNVTKLFADKDFDGDPVKIKEVDDTDIPTEEDEVGEDITDDSNDSDTDGRNKDQDNDDPKDKSKKTKYYIDNVEVKVINKQIQYFDKDGKLVTESLEDFTKNTVKKEYVSLEAFLRKWKSSDKKQVIIDELAEQGVLFDALRSEINKEMDPFDLICHIVYDMPALTRKERATNVRKRNYFTKYGEQARDVLEALLTKYEDEGLKDFEDIKILRVHPFDNFGSVVEIVKNIFGSKDKYNQAVIELERELYSA